MATLWANAQSVDSIPHYVFGYYGPNPGGAMRNIVQMEDGNVLFVHREGINFGGSTSADIVGSTLYKMSRHGGTILDTLFIENSLPAYLLFAKNPIGDDNIRVGFTYDTVNWNSFLQIIPFDNHLNFDSINEVLVPLSDTFAIYINRGCCLINSQNDIVFMYYVENSDGGSDLHFCVFGLDGTLKHENVMPLETIPTRAGGYFGIFNESPLEYYYYAYEPPSTYGQSHVAFHIFDSLFQHKDCFTINNHTIISQNPGRRYYMGWNHFMVVDGDDFVFCCRYEQEGNRNGVCMVRYDKRTLEQKNAVFFESNPMITPNYDTYGAYPIGIGLDSEGSLCFAYESQNSYLTGIGQVAVVKTDADFNVKWQRFCLDMEGDYYRTSEIMAVLDDGGVAIAGNNAGLHEVFFLIVNDDYDALEEQGIIVRPYAYYPNPTRDELHLHYSPDVTPKQIELYDIQGRLVCLQRTGLESLNLQDLSAGTYTMRVTLDGGKVFSDKVVKE